MPGRRMLREMMSVNDIYNYAEAIIEMLREEYGTYDADTLDEVQVEDPFIHRLQARGYEVRTAPEPVARPEVQPVPTPVLPDTPVVPVTVVRTRRSTPNTPTGTTRTRRTTPPVDGSTRSATSTDTGRGSADTGRASTDGPRKAPAAEGSADTSSSAESGDASRAAPTRTRRTTRPRSSNNGEASS